MLLSLNKANIHQFVIVMIDNNVIQCVYMSNYLYIYKKRLTYFLSMYFGAQLTIRYSILMDFSATKIKVSSILSNIRKLLSITRLISIEEYCNIIYSYKIYEISN